MSISKKSAEAWAATVPAGMRALKNWVAHKNKRPFQPTSGVPASVSDSSTWGTFSEALSNYKRSLDDQASGVGFVFTETSGLVFVDFDHVLDGGQFRPGLDPEVQSLAEQCLASTYTEVSPSGNGLHALFAGKLPPGTAHVRSVGDARVEVYDSGRYGTVTGARCNGAVPLSAAPLTLRAVVEYVGTHEAAEPEAAEPEREDEIREALSVLDPDMPRPDWIKVGMALKSGLGEAGRALWEGWSADGSKHRAGEPERLWEGFNKAGVGLGSIIWMAEQCGWSHDGKYTRPEDVFSVLPGAPAQPSGKAPFQLVDACDVEIVPVHWLWTPRIARGQVTVVAGDPKTGKTLMVESLAAMRSKGKALPGDDSADGPKRWVLLESEDDENDTTVPRLKANGANLANVTILRRAAGSVKLADPEHMRHLAAAIQAKGDVEALVISPLNNFVGMSSKLDMHKDQDIRTVLMPLVALAKALNIAVIVIMHLNKGGSSNPLYRVIGSIGAVGVARTVLMVGRKNDQRYVTLAASNSKEAPALKFSIEPSKADENIGVLKWEGEDEEVGAEDIIREAPPTGDKLAGAVAWLLARLKDGPVPTTTLFEESARCGYSAATLKRAKGRAGVTVRKTGGPGTPWSWTLAAAPALP